MTIRWGLRLGVALVIAGLGIGCALGWQRYFDELRVRQQAEERAALAEAQIPTGEPVPDLRDEVRALTSERDELSSRLRALQDAAPSEPELVITHATPEITIPSPDAACPSRAAEGAAVEATAPAVAPSLFALRVETDVIGLRSKAGTWSVLGETAVIQTRPEEREIYREPWRADATRFLVRAEDEGPRWLAGPAVGLVSGRPALGAMVVGPYWRPRLWRWELELRPTAVVMGGSEEWVIAGGITAGW